mgnify:CR=1 FL=1
MANLLGIVAISAATLFVFVLAKRVPAISKMFPIIFILVAPCLPVIRFGKGGRNLAKRGRTSVSEV